MVAKEHFSENVPSAVENSRSFRALLFRVCLVENPFCGKIPHFELGANVYEGFAWEFGDFKIEFLRHWKYFRHKYNLNPQISSTMLSRRTQNFNFMKVIFLKTLCFAKRLPHLQSDGFFHKEDCCPNVLIWRFLLIFAVFKRRMACIMHTPNIPREARNRPALLC